MAEVDATRACVVCGVLFPRNGKRVACSDACMVERRKLHQERSNAKKRQAVVRLCHWCAVEFIKGPGTAAKYCCSDHAAIAKAKRDAARKARPEVRAKSREYSRKHKANPLTDDQRTRYSDRKRQYRVEHGRGNRGREYAARGLRRLAITNTALLWIDAGYHMAHAEALAINAAMDRAARESLKAERDKQDALRAERAKKRGLAASTLKLKEDPERYAAELGRWRAKKLKRKHGISMLADGTATAAVVLGGTRCLYCDCRLNDKNRSHDHMEPVARGGVHGAANIAPCCLDCNSLKGARGFAQWVATLSPKDSRRAVAFYQKRNGSMQQGSLSLALAA